MQHPELIGSCLRRQKQKCWLEPRGFGYFRKPRCRIRGRQKTCLKKRHEFHEERGVQNGGQYLRELIHFDALLGNPLSDERRTRGERRKGKWHDYSSDCLCPPCTQEYRKQAQEHFLAAWQPKQTLTISSLADALPLDAFQARSN